MSLRICSLASGSTGNATYVSSETTSILIDAGISARAIVGRLEEIGVDPGGVQAVCLSHEHDDHVRGLRVLHKRFGVGLYANFGTVEALRRDVKMRQLSWEVFSTGHPFAIGDLEINTFSVSHDAYEPVGYVIDAGDHRIAIATDVGIATALLRERLRGCRLVMVEANHDEQLLQDAPRPWHLKQRIRGRQGHLSNFHTAQMLEEIASPELEQVVLAHLSRDCNRQDLALSEVRSSLARAGHGHVRVSVAPRDAVSEVWSH